MNYGKLHEFIVKAKLNGWVGGAGEGKKIPATRKGSHDITFEEGPYHLAEI